MKRIVIAEASPTIKSVADSLLRQNGYDVVCTSDGLQAWEVISAEKPDLVLTGLALSGISGIELCRQMAGDRLTGGIPVVLMIGAKDSITEEDLVSSGARGKLRKPFSPKDLLEIVGKLAGAMVDQPRPQAKDDFHSTRTKFTAQVSSTQHLAGRTESPALDWMDLEDRKATKLVEKVATFDLSSDDSNLVIEDDQYGLSKIRQEQEAAEAEAAKLPKDDDYDWFVGEMKKEIEEKPPAQPQRANAETGETSALSNPASASNEMRFDDIRSSRGSPERQSVAPILGREKPSGEKSAPIFTQRPPTATKLPASPPAVAQMPVAASVRTLSDEEIALIADRVAMKLATYISAKLDKHQILEAIRSALRP